MIQNEDMFDDIIDAEARYTDSQNVYLLLLVS